MGTGHSHGAAVHRGLGWGCQEPRGALPKRPSCAQKGCTGGGEQGWAQEAAVARPQRVPTMLTGQARPGPGQQAVGAAEEWWHTRADPGTGLGRSLVPTPQPRVSSGAMPAVTAPALP